MYSSQDLIEFLETDSLSVTFSSKGLKYLSLRKRDGEEIIDLYKVEDEDHTSIRYKVIEETKAFLQTGEHNMPLDFSEFTSFQRSVFKAVSEIKKGEIYTYKDIAIKLNNPGASQAIGTAISKNPVSYFLPTHRVISKGGIAECKSGAGFLREKLLAHEGHDVEKLKSGKICKRERCFEE